MGNVIAVFERENSQPITLAQVPPQVLNAFLAVEDEQYYLHHGVNLRGFARALLSNFSSDAPRQGASTISQQVVKNEFLAGLPRDGRYKGLQAHYATMLEKKMSKNAILERYLNIIELGPRTFGIRAAAAYWFGTRGGLSRWKAGRFTTYRQKEGLFHDAVQKVLADDHGYLWLTSNHGIFRIRSAELDAAATGHGRTLHPIGWGPLFGAPAGRATLAGVVSVNACGARRIKAR